MTDKHPEAFEKWFPAGRKLLEYPNSGDAPTGFKAGWQACAAHYAPKLTEKDAVKIAFNASVGKWTPFGKDTAEGWGAYMSEIIAALRAAGVRFKEEA